MQYAVAFFVAIFLICTCHKDERAARAAQEAKIAEQARIEARIAEEVERRTEVVRQELSERADRLHNVRLAGFAALTIGSLAGLIWVRRPRLAALAAPVTPVAPVIPPYRAIQTSQANRVGIIQQPRPQWVNYHPPPYDRVIDLRPPSPPDQQPAQRHRVLQQQGRRRNPVDQLDGWVSQRRRRWGHQPDPPRRHHEN